MLWREEAKNPIVIKKVRNEKVYRTAFFSQRQIVAEVDAFFQTGCEVYQWIFACYQCCPAYLKQIICCFPIFSGFIFELIHAVFRCFLQSIIKVPERCTLSLATNKMQNEASFRFSSSLLTAWFTIFTLFNSLWRYNSFNTATGPELREEALQLRKFFSNYQNIGCIILRLAELFWRVTREFLYKTPF